MNEHAEKNRTGDDPGRSGKGRRLAWRLFGAALGLVVAAELLVGARGRFGVDGWFGFAAWYGFLSCVLLVLLARLVGLVVKRPERYYEDRNV